MAVIFIEQRPVTRYSKEVVDGVEREVAVQAFKEEKKIISLATIQSALGSQFRITGLDGPGESSELALLLRAGGLAAPMYFVETIFALILFQWGVMAITELLYLITNYKV